MTDLEQKALGLVNAQFREPWYKTWQDVPQGVFARAVLHAAKSIEEMKIVVRTLLTDSQHIIEALEAENERLREALRGVTPPAHFGESEQSKAWWAKARAALGEKQ